MGKLAKRIVDKRILGLIRRYLQSGVMTDGKRIESRLGTPQGGPLSPLLANVLLEEVDQELERRGHAFVRYADDGRGFVRSKRAGEQVMRHLLKLYGHLHLTINAAKCAVASAYKRDFLGFGLWSAPGKKLRLRVSKRAFERMKDRVREITSRNRGRSIQSVSAELRRYLLGWRGFFGIVHTNGVLAMQDEWIRGRLRILHLKQWKRGRTAFCKLRTRGASKRVAAEVAGHTHRWWRTACGVIHHVPGNSYFDQMGIPAWTSNLNPSTRRGTDPYARWCGRGTGENFSTAPIPIVWV
ncbi:MAG: RNA-directed DNA polymerase [Planctomycetota bacterium]|jgi:RNA-directed DNA polymerase